jgi:hypothetical protein
MTTEPTGNSELSESEIRRLVSEIAADSPSAEAAWQELRGLGPAVALGHRSYMVRYRACMVLAYSLRREAISALQSLLQHADARTREDAVRALDAIQHQNHHYFVDTQHSGRTFWVVNETDDRLHA